MNKIYAVLQTDDYSASHKENMGFYSTQQLAEKAMETLRNSTPDCYNYEVVSYPFDWMYLPIEEDKAYPAYANGPVDL